MGVFGLHVYQVSLTLCQEHQTFLPKARNAKNKVARNAKNKVALSVNTQAAYMADAVNRLLIGKNNFTFILGLLGNSETSHFQCKRLSSRSLCIIHSISKELLKYSNTHFQNNAWVKIAHKSQPLFTDLAQVHKIPHNFDPLHYLRLAEFVYS